MPVQSIIKLAPDTTARLVWMRGTSHTEGIPSGVLVTHGDCSPMYVRWVSFQHDPLLMPDSDKWELASLVPLTVSPAVRCGSCDRVWRIADGRWLAT